MDDVERRGTWMQRRSAGHVTGFVLAIAAVYVAVTWWSSTRGDGEVVRLGLAWALAAGVWTNTFFVHRRLGDRESRQLFRRAMKDGFVQPGVETERWRVHLESALRQNDGRWATVGTVGMGMLGGAFVVLSEGSLSGTALATGCGVGVVVGAAVSPAMVWQQRRARRRAETLLAELPS